MVSRLGYGATGFSDKRLISFSTGLSHFLSSCFRYARKVNQKNPQNPTKIVLNRPGISLKLMAVRKVQIQTPVWKKIFYLRLTAVIVTSFGRH